MSLNDSNKKYFSAIFDPSDSYGKDSYQENVNRETFWLQPQNSRVNS